MDGKFIKGLKLNEGYYKDVVKEIIESNYPELNYSAGLIGYGSDVFGFDTPVSMDHNWGPRLILFLSEQDFDEYQKRLDNLFRNELPYEYKGFPTNYTSPDSDQVQRMKKIKKGQVNHLIEITTLSRYLERYLGFKDVEYIELLDWLKIPEQGLLEVTAGKVFYDGLGQLHRVREYLNFYPEDILKLKLAALWNYISQEEAFVGRNVDLGEEIGVKLISHRIVNTLMKICFYLEKEYIPYSKWFTKSFKELNCYNEISETIQSILDCQDLNEIEERICEGYQKVISLQNNLGLTKKIDLAVNDYYGRPYKVVFTDQVADYLKDSIKAEKISKLNLDYLSIIQNLEGIDMTDNQKLLNKLFD